MTSIDLNFFNSSDMVDTDEWLNECLFHISAAPNNIHNYFIFFSLTVDYLGFQFNTLAIFFNN